MAVYSVSQVTSHLRQALDSDPLLADLWVIGEVSNLRVSSSGHSYYTLRDDQAVLNCVMFRGQPGAELLANGTAVSAHGRITFYEPRGSTDFMVDLAMPQGVGELSLELERLRLRLEAEGLFAESRKRPLPHFPAVVGLVTSPAGAVFHDIENVIRRRYPLAQLLLSPTPGPRGRRCSPDSCRLGRPGPRRPGRRDYHCQGRRLFRGPVALQRRDRRPGHLRQRDSRCQRRRPRDRLHHRRLRSRRQGPHTVGRSRACGP